MMIQTNLLIFYCLVALYSLAIGSLLNVVIYRLPIMIKNEWSLHCQNLLSLPTSVAQPINLFLPRSFCPACKTTIKAWHNIPIVSFLLLKGRCSKCMSPISWRYPLIELSTMLLSIVASIYLGPSIKLLCVLVFLYLNIALIFIDIDEQLLPDCLSLGLLWLGLLANTQAIFIPLTTAVYSAVLGYLFLWLFIKIYYLITGKIGMGHGDFKLFAALSAWFGWTALPFILLFASLTGGIFGLAQLYFTNKSKDSPIPFGPFLCLAGLIKLILSSS